MLLRQHFPSAHFLVTATSWECWAHVAGLKTTLGPKAGRDRWRWVNPSLLGFGFGCEILAVGVFAVTTDTAGEVVSGAVSTMSPVELVFWGVGGALPNRSLVYVNHVN